MGAVVVILVIAIGGGLGVTWLLFGREHKTSAPSRPDEPSRPDKPSQFDDVFKLHDKD